MAEFTTIVLYIIDTDGSEAGLYRKCTFQTIPTYEKFYFTPGDLGF
jgi:predicted amidohydrolase